jgi:uncharacterized protein (DUF2249 family)/quercetin dioxygenase-like cupin family protein
MIDDALDVRQMRKPDKHPAIFARFRALDPGDGFDLVNNHNPVHLRDEFESEYPGSFGWEYLETGPSVWRIRISKLSAAALPRLLYDTSLVEAGDGVVAGATWKLEVRERDLDSNVIRLAPDDGIDAHEGPDIDVIIHVVAGTGRLDTELDPVELTAGALVWLPRRSRRGFTAGSEGLTYLTVHQRKPALTLIPSNTGLA